MGVIYRHGRYNYLCLSRGLDSGGRPNCRGLITILVQVTDTARLGEISQDIHDSQNG